MESLLDLEQRVNKVFNQIESFIGDDNIITEKEFVNIQELKKKLNVTSKQIYFYKKKLIDKILYLQFYLLLLDDNIDFAEKKEIIYYKKIFGYSKEELLDIKENVIDDKKTNHRN